MIILPGNSAVKVSYYIMSDAATIHQFEPARIVLCEEDSFKLQRFQDLEIHLLDTMLLLLLPLFKRLILDTYSSFIQEWKIIILLGK